VAPFNKPGKSSGQSAMKSRPKSEGFIKDIEFSQIGPNGFETLTENEARKLNIKGRYGKPDRRLPSMNLHQMPGLPASNPEWSSVSECSAMKHHWVDRAALHPVAVWVEERNSDPAEAWEE
jgi:hypothetical protein